MISCHEEETVEYIRQNTRLAKEIQRIEQGGYDRNLRRDCVIFIGNKVVKEIGKCVEPVVDEHVNEYHQNIFRLSILNKIFEFLNAYIVDKTVVFIPVVIFRKFAERPVRVNIVLVHELLTDIIDKLRKRNKQIVKASVCRVILTIVAVVDIALNIIAVCCNIILNSFSGKSSKFVYDFVNQISILLACFYILCRVALCRLVNAEVAYSGCCKLFINCINVKNNGNSSVSVSSTLSEPSSVYLVPSAPTTGSP